MNTLSKLNACLQRAAATETETAVPGAAGDPDHYGRQTDEQAGGPGGLSFALCFALGLDLSAGFAHLRRTAPGARRSRGLLTSSTPYQSGRHGLGGRRGAAGHFGQTT